MKGSQGAQADFGIRDSLRAAWLGVHFSSQGVTGLLVSYSQDFKRSLGGVFCFCFFASLKQIHVRLAIYLKHLTASKSTTH